MPTQAVPNDATRVSRDPVGRRHVAVPDQEGEGRGGPESAGKAGTAGRAAWIGRALDNDIVIHDVLASRRHAFLEPTPAGIEIRDANSINGTFVNGLRVGSALLTEGDVVTIGNVDLVFTAGMLARRLEAATSTGGLEVRDVGFAISGKDLLQQISMTARPGTLTAIIGGSGAGKSTLSRLVAGYTTPTAGAVTFEGHNIHTSYASLRSRIGMVPQDDVVHRQLTVNQALGYAAELRLPPDTSKADRDQVVAQVLDELGLTEHAETRVDKLSGGQRKRASVALELLTGPSLLILDEPTSGLDPALDLQVMTMLRQLADAGRVVLVVTHSLTYLDVCDQVLLMAPGGKIAFLGAPGQIGEAMGTSNWAEIFAKVGADPDEANRRFLARQEHAPPTRSETPADLGAPSRSSMLHQFSTIARRQIRLIISDRAYFAFLALLPFILGALSLTVPGNTGFGVADPASETPDEAAQILTLLVDRRRLHGYRADDPRSDRRARHLPARAGGRPVHRCLPERQDHRVLRVRHHSGSDRDGHRAAGQGCTQAAGAIARQCEPGAVRHRRRNMRGVGDSRLAAVVDRPLQRTDHAAAGGVADAAAGACRWHGSGDRPDLPRPNFLADAVALGLRGIGVDGKSAGCWSASAPRTATGYTRTARGCSTWACSAHCR